MSLMHLDSSLFDSAGLGDYNKFYLLAIAVVDQE
jgi:hypothetical protein